MDGGVRAARQPGSVDATVATVRRATITPNATTGSYCGS